MSVSTSSNMDAIFLLGVQERDVHLLGLMRSLGATYICLWSYLPHPHNCLLFYDGRYQEDSDQPMSSSGSSVARRLFEEYRKLYFLVSSDHVPGSAFVTNRPYMEATQVELHLMAQAETQRLFYREARIKTAVFMGCKSGEIELGWSNVSQTTNMQNEMRNWFPEDFSRQSPLREISQAADPNRQSSSPSSLISLSMDSPDCSSFAFNVNPRTTQLPETQIVQPLLQVLGTNSQLQPPIITNATSSNPLHEVIQHLQGIPLQQYQRPTPFSLTRESVDAEITRAILAVLTSPTSPSSSSTSTRNLPAQVEPERSPRRPSAFKRYNLGLVPRALAPGSGRSTSFVKRAIAYYRRLNVSLSRDHMQMAAGNRPTVNQLHHMISERKRREKINESFQALRSLLPPDTKKDKASVLARTREYLANLKAQVSELTKRKDQLESQLLRMREDVQEVTQSSSASGDRLAVRITTAPESSASDRRVVDVQVLLRAQHPISDLVIRVLEFLKLDTNVSLISVEASTFVAESASINRVILRLRIEGNEWDESAFQEALKRVLDDLTR